MHLESRIILLCSEISSHNRVIVGTVPLFTCCIQLKNFDNRKHLSVLLIDVKTDKEQEPCMEFGSCPRVRQPAGAAARGGDRWPDKKHKNASATK